MLFVYLPAYLKRTQPTDFFSFCNYVRRVFKFISADAKAPQKQKHCL